MKKLAIVALALVLAMTFVGCGATVQVLGDWKEEGTGWYTNLNFKADKTCTYEYFTYNVQTEEYVKTSSFSGEWVSDAADQITISGDKMFKSLVGTWTVSVEGDALKLSNGNKTHNFTRATK